MFDPLTLVFGVGIFSVLVALWLAFWVLKQPEGSERMREIAGYIREGAEAFIKRQYSTIALLAIVFGIILYVGFSALGQHNRALPTAISFLFGAFSSAVAGIVAMYVAVRANGRTAAAATKSASSALNVSFKGGAVAGLIIISFSLLGVSALYLLFGANPTETPFIIVGYGFGASFVALFAQLGGGIYTKAADVGADLVGKVEKGIPEDDPRNPAVIADLVGDNVGDCAGRGADLFESTAAENIGAMILGVALFPVFGISGVIFPLVARAFGLIASIIGIFSVRMNERENPMAAMNRGYYIACIISALGFYAATMWLLNNIWFFYAGLVGILTSIAFVYITQYYTEKDYRPVKEIANASRTGPATNILSGFGVALESTAPTIVTIAIALLVAFYCGEASGIARGGLYGTAIATMGMLATAAFILSLDTFGPIADNAGGIVQMSQASASVRARTDRLDAVGNTTKALTKGYAIGSAALAAFLLFTAYLDEVAALTGKAFDIINIAKVDVFVGAMIGAMLIFLFSAFAIRAVSQTAVFIIEDVRNQFKDKRILQGKKKPNYARCVDITASGALRNMVLPSLLAVLIPVVVGILLKAEAVAAFLMVGTIGGILMATTLNNGGGSWDNAKKYIEEGNFGGKGSEAHKAAVVGDTVGDPFKDCAGPSIHVLIKLLSTITLVLSPLFL
jgi:K(+)-stimulated pyrophosphate-energized sodium pump